MNTVEIIFSPTGGTEKVAHIIGGQWSENPDIRTLPVRIPVDMRCLPALSIIMLPR